jgi:hypothetical protein
MAWPPVSNISTGLGYKSALPTTLAWGTDDLYSGVIVTSIRPSQMIEEIKVENGVGNTVTQVLINDGTQVEITCVDDRAVSWPSSGATVTLLNPLPTGTGATSTVFQVVDNSYQGSRKAAGERTLLCKKYTKITPAQL